MKQDIEKQTKALKSEFLHCRMSKELTDAVNKFCEETSLTRTATVERALKRYLSHYKETGKI